MRTTSRLLLFLLMLGLPSVALASRDQAAPWRIDPSPTLLARYAINGGAEWNNWVYRPRQWDAGAVVVDESWGDFTVTDPGAMAGWDVLDTDNAGSIRRNDDPAFLTLTLNRAATLVIVWRGGALPAWMEDWVFCGHVTTTNPLFGTQTFPVYRKTFPTGDATLGGVNDPGGTAVKNVYWVLLAEENGEPSPSPQWPDGEAQPLPNETCPVWLHLRFHTTGPDGGTYLTWHSQIDPVYWCYYRHEHGSDPASFDPDFLPPFNYAVGRMGMSEAHVGSKLYVINDGYATWLIEHHFGTGTLAGVCNAHHEVGIWVKRNSDGAWLVRLHFVGNFGASVENVTELPLTPDTCPNQGTNATGTGVRQFPSVASGGALYEPWRLGELDRRVIGITGNITVNTPDTAGICDDVHCNHLVKTAGRGTSRFISPAGFGIVDPGDTADGVFWTDPMGMARVAEGTPGAIEQFILPGLKLSYGCDNHAADALGWGQRYVCGTTAGDASREGSVPPGGPN